MIKEIIIDTDIGCDSDDAGALATAYALQMHSKCRVTAITHCTSRIDGCNTIDAISRYYGVKDIPIGIYKPDGFLDNPNTAYYTKYVQAHFEHKFSSKNECPDAVKILRRSLVNADNGNVSLIALGPSVNISDLIDSNSDEISKLSGKELIAQKQCNLIIMGGCFDKNLYKHLDNNAEWNIKQAIKAAKNVFENFPNKIDVIPFETGYDIITGKTLPPSENNPVWVSYREFGHIGRSSWDPCAVLFAVEKNNDFWNISEIGNVSISDDGVSSFKTSLDGKHRIINPKNKNKITECLESLIGFIPVF